MVMWEEVVAGIVVEVRDVSVGRGLAPTVGGRDASAVPVLDG